MSEITKYNQLVDGLHESYPKMFSRPYGGVDVGEGWWPIIKSLCKQIDGYTSWRNNTRLALLNNNPHRCQIPEHVEQVVVSQIKEKFGGLRFYYDGGDERIYGMVEMAEEWAAHTCEECGAPGKFRRGGWVRVLCEYHEEIRQAKLKAHQEKE